MLLKICNAIAELFRSDYSKQRILSSRILTGIPAQVLVAFQAAYFQPAHLQQWILFIITTTITTSKNTNTTTITPTTIITTFIN